MNKKIELIFLTLILVLNFSCVEKKSTEKEVGKSELVSNLNSDTLIFTSGINSIFQDSKGNFWYGSRQEGAVVFDGQSLKYFTTNEGLPNNQIRSIKEDSNGNIWFGDRDTGVWKYDGKRIKNYTNRLGLDNDFVHTIYKDNMDELWFILTNGNVFKFNGKTFNKQF